MSSSAIAVATPEMIARYEPVIGLEVHVQLATATKIFCGCPTSFGAPPNTNVCPVCLGLPGALPVLSRDAVELALRGALALNCNVNPVSRVARIHMEDDAGKSQHDGFFDSARYTYVDLNRSGTPLIEIVSEPDMRTSDEAFAYVTELKQSIQFMDVSTCDMEKGHLRCDANVSVRLWGAPEFGTKVEIKNLNSFRFMKLAIDYEVGRQVGVIEGGGSIPQETRLFNPDTGVTVGMRSKE